MKHTYTLLLPVLALLFFPSCEFKPDAQQSEETAIVEETGYDSLLAKKYGADDYGMKKYVMAFLKRGPNPSKDSATAAELQRAHLQNINRMAEEGKLSLAGPFFGSGELRGIYVFNVSSIEEAEALTNSDPAIQAGALDMDLLEWYGPAGLMAINELHEKLSKKSIVQ